MSRLRGGFVITTVHRSPHQLRPSQFVTEVRIPSGTVRLRLLGRLDAADCPPLEAALSRADQDAGGALLIFDLAGLEALDLTAARVLVAATQRRRRHGRGRSVVLHVRPDVDATLRATRDEEVLEVIDPAGALAVPARPAKPVTDSVVLQGEVSSWTVLALRREIGRRCRRGGGRLVIDLRWSTVPDGPVAAALGRALRRFEGWGRELHVLGAPTGSRFGPPVDRRGRGARAADEPLQLPGAGVLLTDLERGAPQEHPGP